MFASRSEGTEQLVPGGPLVLVQSPAGSRVPTTVDLLTVSPASMSPAAEEHGVEPPYWKQIPKQPSYDPTDDAKRWRTGNSLISSSMHLNG